MHMQSADNHTMYTVQKSPIKISSPLKHYD